MERLKDKVVLVTGSTTGIGKAIAKRCVEEGARVVLHGLEEEWGRAAQEEMGKDVTALYIEDLSQEGAAQRLVDFTVAAFERLDVLVNNAAWVAPSNIQNTDSDFFRKILEVNTLAPFFLIQAALPHLSQGKGCVLNIGSINAWSGEPDLLAYSVSKGALMTLTRNLGDTLHREHGVRVNQINPGWILTENEIKRKREHGLSEHWYEELPSLYAPAGRIIWPAEIASAAIYWIADESGPISGQVVDLEQHPMLGRNPPKDRATVG
jgi:NAD(P)-dependent dehydrogenase (short-subunit alcohol dehydrogenase family)